MNYDLDWTQVDYDVSFIKGGREIPFKVSMAHPIPAEDLMNYERSLVRPHRSDKDGGTTIDITPSGKEVTLFDKYFVHISGSDSLPKEEVVKQIPQAIKWAVVSNGIFGVWVDRKKQEEEGVLADLLTANVEVELNAFVNDEVLVLKHTLKEPDAEDELVFRRATAGSMKQLPGRRRPEYLIISDVKIFVSLYDKLIQEVKGYEQSGKELDFGGEKGGTWVHKIPYPHKKAVVSQIFGTAVVRQDKEEEFFRSSK